MSAHDEALVAAMVTIASNISAEGIEFIARAIEHATWEHVAAARSAVLTQITPAPLRSRVHDLLERWQRDCAHISAAGIATGLRAASATAQRVRVEQTMELLWTGPTIPQVALRRTEDALLDVIRTASSRLLIISFAVYPTPTIIGELEHALARGVSVDICVEVYEANGTRMEYDTIAALGPVADRCTIYIWPLAERIVNEQGRVGRMHVKCAIADRQLMFLSSANLTGAALQANMELGVLIRGGALPERVQSQYDQMIARSVLQKLR